MPPTTTQHQATARRSKSAAMSFAVLRVLIIPNCFARPPIAHIQESMRRPLVTLRSTALPVPVASSIRAESPERSAAGYGPRSSCWESRPVILEIGQCLFEFGTVVDDDAAQRLYEIGERLQQRVKLARRSTNFPSRELPWFTRLPIVACWLRRVLVTGSVVFSSVPIWSRRSPMTWDRLSMLASACGTSGGTLFICAGEGAHRVAEIAEVRPLS